MENKEAAYEHQDVSPAAVCFLLQMVPLPHSQLHFLRLSLTNSRHLKKSNNLKTSQFCLVAAFLFNCGAQL